MSGLQPGVSLWYEWANDIEMRGGSIELNYRQQATPSAGAMAEPAERALAAGCDAIIRRLQDSSESFSLSKMPATAVSYLVARFIKRLRKCFVLVVPNDRDVEAAVDEINFLASRKPARADQPLAGAVWAMPSRTGHKAQRLGKTEIIARRLAALYALHNVERPTVLVVSALALLERLMPREVLGQELQYLVAGEEIDLDDLCRKLAMCGYYSVPLVEEFGDMSRRGGVLDLYSPLYKWPLRLEFFGDELESIRLFHPVTQRSLGSMEDVILLPASEIILDDRSRQRAQRSLMDDVNQGRLAPTAANMWLEKLEEGHQLAAFEPVLSAFYDRLDTLFDYLEEDAVIVWSDMPQIRKVLHEAYDKALHRWRENRSAHEWRHSPQQVLQDPQQLLATRRQTGEIWCNALSVPGRCGERFALGIQGQEELQAAVREHARRERLLEPLAERFRAWQGEGLHCHLVCSQPEQAGRYLDLLKNYRLQVDATKDFVGVETDPSSVCVTWGPLRRGFVWAAESLALVCEEEIFGKQRRRRARKKTVKGLFLNSFQDLQLGDYVVHVDHGIGVYRGLVHLRVGRQESDFLQLEYHGGDKLYVPVDKLQKVQKYLGIEGQDPPLERLGGRSWERAKRKVREAAERIAQELLKLYAMRRVREGHRFSPPDDLFKEFETTFGFEETPDQLRAIDDVLDDMVSAHPMDRLVCGDVGYGKTEVALRAAFKAIMDGKQVALLVPTTVLAEQHYQTCRERFADFPIVVDVLSRFKTAKQQKQVLEGLKKGTIDMVIGTHRLLQDDVTFRDLGLLIIDEEHRFGVKHKEKMKRLRVAVDVLTLTATPIPRTLHMALSGIRDLSTIETPPEDRRAVETYVSAYDELTIREAIERELARGGQVYFVHNHVQSINRMAARLEQLVPGARIAVAHGQMKERELEKVMLEFVKRRTDVLVCTTIIESGLDIPAANTIIINRADKLGLAQIYQLRGRVGRSSEQAFAYLLIPGEHLISRDAQKRLRALMDFSELGAGFKIALNDLQIRGGGTILGSRQSGHIAAVGYELYLELLEETIAKMKGEVQEEERVEAEISLPVSAFLPDTFITDTDQRLMAYKRLAAVGEEADVDDLAREWRDRYGPLPAPVKALVILAKIRLLAVRLKIVQIEGDTTAYSFQFAAPIDAERVTRVLEQEKCFLQFPQRDRLMVELGDRGALRQLARLKRILQKLNEHDRDSSAGN